MSRGRKVYSPEFKARVVEEYQRSELSQAEFARKHDIKLTTLHSWIYRPSRNKANDGSPPASDLSK